MTRAPGWRSRLSAYVAQVSRDPFAFGQNDCALFAAGAVLAMTGSDYAAPYRGRYTTLIGGLRHLRRAGFADHIALAAATFPTAKRGSPGDLAVVETPDGPALGVVQGAGIYVLGPDAVHLVPLSHAATFFEVR